MEDETTGITIKKKGRCLELEERALKAEGNCSGLESELQRRKTEFESLELRFKELESEKIVVEQDLRNLKECEEDSLIKQIMVNRALEVDKQVAENQAEDWKRKFEKLSETVRKLDEIGALRHGEFELESLDEDVKLGLELARIKSPTQRKTESFEVYDDALSRKGLTNHHISGSLYITTPAKDYTVGRNRDNLSSRRRQVKKVLVFEGNGTKSNDAVDLADSETEERNGKESDVKDSLEEKSVGQSYEDEAVEDGEANTGTPLGSRKRKRLSSSDSENDIISRLRRDKSLEKWEYVTDMRSDFRKDAELCMRAVCVLYRFQTEDEKATRSTYVSNGRGFSMSDAERGTLIGQFLTDGDPAGDLKKSVEELQSFEPGAVEFCRVLAVRYSKQLLQIYNKREDPYFAAPPSPRL